MSFKVLEDKKDDVLNETIAQGILQELTSLRGLGGNHNKRWGIELLQNALDASKQEGVDVQIRVEDSTLVFSHNGRSFAEEELIHLIYHGSTKVEVESASGKLGTGFLATHLLSPRVRVTGTLRETQKFAFVLDRDAQTLEQLTQKMKVTWRELESSLHRLEINDSKDTTFEYALLNDSALEMCREGIAVLKQTIPITLAFDSRLRSVTIAEGSETLRWSRGESRDLLVPIEITRNGESNASQVFGMLVMREDDLAVGLPLSLNGRNYSLLDVSNFPRLYYPLPLLGTTIFPFPALISSMNFMPTTDREGALLTNEDFRSVAINKDLIERSFTLLEELLRHVSEGNYGNLYNISRVPKPSAFPNWLNEQWMETLVIPLISKLRDARLVLAGGSMITPKDAHIPVAAEVDAPALWELSNLLYPKSTPDEIHSRVWRDVLVCWASHLYPNEMAPEKLDEALTLEKLVKTVEESQNVAGLQSALGEKSVSSFTNELVRLILNSKQDALFEENAILPDQTGIFRVKKALSRDPGISEELKNVLDLLGRDLRTELLSMDITIDAINFRTEEDVLLDALKRVRDQAKTHHNTGDYHQANLRLFQWLIDTKKLEEIREAYPIITRRDDLHEGESIRFFSQETSFLAPESVWNAEDRQYVDVFPSRSILSKTYDCLTQDQWKTLSDNNLVWRDLSLKELASLDNKQMRALCVDDIKEDDKIDHKSKEAILATSIPFLEDKDWGIIDRVRSSQHMTSRFLSFVLGSLIKKDKSWKEPLTNVNCECASSHAVYPSLWLKTLRTRQWVPIVGGGEGERPSSENLAPFFTNSDLMDMLSSDPDVTHFLGNLGVNVSVLMTANKSKVDQREIDRAFSRFLASTGGDPKELSRLAEAYADPGLRTKLLDALAEKQFVQANRRIGELVERIIRDKLGERLPKDTYSVEKVTTGSDARITVTSDGVEPSDDFLDETGREIFVRISVTAREHLLEIKSARQQSVRITIPQARQAHKVTAAFTLCVVEVPANIADISEEQAQVIVLQNARFVSSIGDKLEGMLDQVDAFQSGEKALESQETQGLRVDVISAAQIRIQVSRPVWLDGLDFGGFLELIAGANPEPANSIKAEIVTPGE